MNTVTFNTRHGGPFDRGAADAYYGRPAIPHYFVGNTYSSPKVTADKMTAEEIDAYYEGFNTTSDRKDWGTFDE